MIHSEYSDTCTVLLRDALEMAYQKLDVDGTLDRLYKKLVATHHTRPSSISCADEDKSDEMDEEETQPRLDIPAVGGSILLHLFGKVVSLILFCYREAKSTVMRTVEVNDVEVHVGTDESEITERISPANS